MANLNSNGISIIVTIIWLMHSKNARSTILPLFNEQQDYDDAKCFWSIIKNGVYNDLTLVNVHDNSLIKKLNLQNIKILQRTFLAMELDEPNEAYVVQCDDFYKCKSGFDDLVKDRYWNPKAVFFITIKNTNCILCDQKIFFQRLHILYVFKVVLVLNKRVYFYDFEIADRCAYTAKAIRDYECKSLASNDSSRIFADIKSSLEEKPKTPYSECNMSVLVSVVVPFVFPPSEEKTGFNGYEEEFIAILKRMNFNRIQFLHTTNLSSTGAVCEDFTVTGNLRDLQAGVVDYVMGGILLSHYRLQIFDFTYPHWCDDFLLVVPKARQIDKWEIMYTVFNPIVWGLISVTFVCVTLVAFVLKVNGKRDMHVLVLTLFDMYGYFTNNASKKSPSLFLLSWALFAWLITCFYQCDLASIFTKPTYYTEINSLHEIFYRNYTFYLSTTKYNYLKGSDELDMGGLVQKSVIRKSDYDCLKAIAYERKKYTLASRLGYLYFEPEFHKDNGEAMLHRVTEPYSYVFRTGFLRKGNPNLKRIRFLEQQVIAFGLHRRSLLSYIHMNKLKFYKRKESNWNPLTCQDIAGIYYTYMCGCGISLIAFFIEIVLNK